MKKELKEKWVAALRSGNYQQGRYALKRTNNTYCCLGVLCEVGGETFEFQPPSELIDYPTACQLKRFPYQTAYLPSQLYTEFGLDKQITRELIALNDDKGLTFSEIADYIEANIPAD